MATTKDKPTERKITLSEYEHCTWDGERFNYEPRGRKGLREAGATDEQINAAVGYLATWAMHDGGSVTITIYGDEITASYSCGFYMVGVWRASSREFSFHS